MYYDIAYRPAIARTYTKSRNTPHQVGSFFIKINFIVGLHCISTTVLVMLIWMDGWIDPPHKANWSWLAFTLQSVPGVSKAVVYPPTLIDSLLWPMCDTIQLVSILDGHQITHGKWPNGQHAGHCSGWQAMSLRGPWYETMHHIIKQFIHN